MKNTQQCKAWLLKYVPNVTRDAFVVIGILAENESGTFANTKLLDDWHKVVAIDAAADLQYLETFKREIELAWPDVAERRRLLHLMEDSVSNAIQISPMTAFTTSDPQNEFDILATQNLQFPDALSL